MGIANVPPGDGKKRGTYPPICFRSIADRSSEMHCEGKHPNFYSIQDAAFKFAKLRTGSSWMCSVTLVLGSTLIDFIDMYCGVLHFSPQLLNFRPRPQMAK